MSSPFTFDVAQLLHETMPEQRTQVGPTPERIGLEMIAVPQGGEVTVDATLTPLGEGILVDAHVTGTLEGQCARCLRDLHPQLDISVSQVFSASDDFIGGDPAESDEDEIPQVVGNSIDLLQTVIDEAGISLPFAPSCGQTCDVDTPEGVTTGISGEEERLDPRWSGLEKFL
ncbi:MAG: YceD family protein [Corynebacterium sp.]|nr:YceD family protein [Corynebacterium sp.]